MEFWTIFDGDMEGIAFSDKIAVFEHLSFDGYAGAQVFRSEEGGRCHKVTSEIAEEMIAHLESAFWNQLHGRDHKDVWTFFPAFVQRNAMPLLRELEDQVEHEANTEYGADDLGYYERPKKAERDPDQWREDRLELARIDPKGEA